MVKARGFLHITISVADVARSTAFYRDMLGCEIIHQNPIMTFMRTGDDQFVLTQLDHHVSPNSPGPPDQETTLFHHAFLVDDDDFERAVKTLPRDGVSSWECTERGHTTFPGRRHLYFHDPDGNSIELATLLPTDRAARAQG
jgi:catechol 2,3-dioxygenase-like lactoylglutathione lyase family enzyme